MALPNSPITPIPNNEPDAIPSLWNTRYTEIDENFSNLDGRVTSNANEISAARGEESSLDARIDEIEADLSVVNAEAQQAVGTGVMFALDQAALAAQEAQLLRTHIQQEGEVSLDNRGIIKGCSLTKSATSARNVSISAGIAFFEGRPWIVPEEINAASVPSNTGSGNETVYAYLYYDATLDQVRVTVTPLGETVPDDGIPIYTITIPAGSTDATDQFLAAVTLTKTARTEPDFPRIMASPQTHAVSINTISDSDYHITFDVVSAKGEPVSRDDIRVFSRATNGFVMQVANAADAIKVRWRVSNLDN